MYIIDDTYFQGSKREIPNLDEADSKSYAELELLIDDECRLFMHYFLTPSEVVEFDSYLEDGMFPNVTTGIPQKWIDLVNGTTYTSNGVDLIWNGLIYSKGSYFGSLLADYVYFFWLETQASYMTGVGDAKGNPKGASLVNPTQRIVTVWNEFVKQYQIDLWGCFQHRDMFRFSIPSYGNTGSGNELSLMQFISDHPLDYVKKDVHFFEIKNQLGL